MRINQAGYDETVFRIEFDVCMTDIFWLDCCNSTVLDNQIEIAGL